MLAPSYARFIGCPCSQVTVQAFRGGTSLEAREVMPHMYRDGEEIT